MQSLPRPLQRVAVLLAALALAACNTVNGVGKDVKAAGTAIEKAADSARPK